MAAIVTPKAPAKKVTKPKDPPAQPTAPSAHAKGSPPVHTCCVIYPLANSPAGHSTSSSVPFVCINLETPVLTPNQELLMAQVAQEEHPPSSVDCSYSFKGPPYPGPWRRL